MLRALSKSEQQLHKRQHEPDQDPEFSAMFYCMQWKYVFPGEYENEFWATSSDSVPAGRSNSIMPRDHPINTLTIGRLLEGEQRGEWRERREKAYEELTAEARRLPEAEADVELR
jgi:hypothetical protein